MVCTGHYAGAIAPGALGIECHSRWTLERCQSGRMGLTANELTWETGSEGSNPSLSASVTLSWVG